MLPDDITSYLRRTDLPLSLNRLWENMRFVVIDTESTGTDPRKDQLISMAGVAVWGGDIQIADSFEVVVPVTHNTSSVMIHGITKEEASRGVSLDLALGKFCDWLGDGIIVGHHIEHDVTMLSHAAQRFFGIMLSNCIVDTMDLFLELERHGAFQGKAPISGYSLDSLCSYFSITPHDRHTASGDAFLTAQIFIRLLKTSRRFGLHSLQSISARFPMIELKNF